MSEKSRSHFLYTNLNKCRFIFQISSYFVLHIQKSPPTLNYMTETITNTNMYIQEVFD